MKCSLLECPSVPASARPYRLLDERGQEIAWANAFLDAQRIRPLSLRSLRAYAFDLLNSPAGGRIQLGRYRKSPSPSCSIMSASNSTNNPGLRRKL
jgi:hypothetical protein